MATLPIAASRPGICSSLCGHRPIVHLSKLCSPRAAKSAVELVMFSVLHSHVPHGIWSDMVRLRLRRFLTARFARKLLCPVQFALVILMLNSFEQVQKVQQHGLHRGTTKKDKIHILGCIAGHLPQPKSLTTRSRWGAVVLGLTLTAIGSTKSCLLSTGSQQRAWKGAEFAKQVSTLSW